jgi:hypothetical protein
MLFVKCSDSKLSEEQIKEKAIKITELLDSNSVEIFHEWNYGQRGDYGIWTKLSGDSSQYTCWYIQRKDTQFLRVYQPMGFINDFPANYFFDTSRFWEFNFVEYKGRIFRIQSIDKKGRDNITDTLLPVEGLFFKRNPFDKLASLTLLKDNLSVKGISYNVNIGNFVEFWLSPRYKLTFLPDSLKLNPKSEKFWLDDFAKGKTIKKNWNLRRVN